jgi:hypothetical protein
MSTVKTNTLTGTTSAGSIVVTGEGGSTTTNLQQGLCKSWWQYDQTNDATDGSLNVSSISDDSTGLYTPTLSNPQSSITSRSVQLTSNHENADGHPRMSCVRHDKTGSFTTSAITCSVFYHEDYALADNNHNFGNVYGDLA